MNMQVGIGQSKTVSMGKMFLPIICLFLVTTVTTQLAPKYAQVGRCINVKMASWLWMRKCVLVAAIAAWHALTVHLNLTKKKVT
ncbi:hypothetical protein PROVRUST_05873 [Providencia rustigianii DSM 4541]|uniref:Uncharacterized protein n=1 Tax=Providencia rustigianii DSM 4541 TaxID=500637 RepID=D1P155_9GAMM|nr:hypothetical protein PROVRUST_05873 [Providencia rustigianii DSM 4541]